MPYSIAVILKYTLLASESVMCDSICGLPEFQDNLPDYVSTITAHQGY